MHHTNQTPLAKSVILPVWTQELLVYRCLHLLVCLCFCVTLVFLKDSFRFTKVKHTDRCLQQQNNTSCDLWDKITDFVNGVWLVCREGYLPEVSILFLGEGFYRLAVHFFAPHIKTLNCSWTRSFWSPWSVRVSCSALITGTKLQNKSPTWI